jgi:hypothetical protein
LVSETALYRVTDEVFGTQIATQRTAGDVHAVAKVRAVWGVTVGIRYSGGWSITPPSPRPRIGARSSAPRVVSERLDGPRYVVTFEGLAGTTQTFRLRGSRADGTTRDVAVTFPATGANADGFTVTTLTFTADSP